jgi:hypothetical protein
MVGHALTAGGLGVGVQKYLHDEVLPVVLASRRRNVPECSGSQDAGAVGPNLSALVAPSRLRAGAAGGCFVRPTTAI